MNIFKYTVYSQENRERAQFNIWPEGEYYFEILEAKNSTSKNGNSMIVLNLSIKKDKFDNECIYIKDYIVDMEQMSWKISNLMGSIGLGVDYVLGEIDLDILPGKNGHLILKVEPPKGDYGHRNAVKDYLVMDRMAAVVDKSNAVKSSVDEFNDEIPF